MNKNCFQFACRINNEIPTPSHRVTFDQDRKSQYPCRQEWSGTIFWLAVPKCSVIKRWDREGYSEIIFHLWKLFSMQFNCWYYKAAQAEAKTREVLGIGKLSDNNFSNPSHLFHNYSFPSIPILLPTAPLHLTLTARETLKHKKLLWNRPFFFF